MYSSWSWRLSKPIRIADSFVRKALAKPSNPMRGRQVAGKDNYENYAAEYEKQRNTVFSHEIKFSIAVPLYNSDEQFLKEMILSVMGQSYQNWELCLLDASDTQNEYVGTLCRNAAKLDTRILYKKVEKNGGISGNTNAAIAMATGDYIALLDHDDLLTSDALFENAKAINDHEAEVLYSDEIHLSESGEFVHPFYKPDWSPDLLFSHNYICHFLVAKKDQAAK